MKKLSEALKQMLDALAYAHAGEYLTQREKLRILAQKSGSIDTVPVKPEPEMDMGSNARRVALYLGSELPPEVMDYVIQTCARLQHELTVLTFETENTARALLESHGKALEEARVGMKLELLSSSEQPIPGLSRYLRSHPEIAFLACKDSGYLGHSYLNGAQQQNSLPVPVVVVTTQTEATRKPVPPAADQNRSSSVVA